MERPIPRGSWTDGLLEAYVKKIGEILSHFNIHAPAEH